MAESKRSRSYFSEALRYSDTQTISTMSATRVVALLAMSQKPNGNTMFDFDFFREALVGQRWYGDSVVFLVDELGEYVVKPAIHSPGGDTVSSRQ